MRRWMLAAVAGAALTTAAMPAQAAWKTYINRELGFSFMAPGEVKTDIGTFRGNYAGPRQTIVYRSVEDNIEYKVTVMSFIQAQAEGATILGEREYMFQDGKGKKVSADTFGRVGSGKDAVYGRKIVVDLPDNKGRTTGAFYFTKGRLISLEATLLPANGNSPDSGRFIDSIVFGLSRTEPGAVELETPQLE
jgi:hypothetical protein